MTETVLTPTPPTADADGEFWARRDPDGDVYVDRADPVIAVSIEVVGRAVLGVLDNATFDQAARTITFKAANGRWTYRIDGQHTQYPHAFTATMISGPGTMPGPVNTTTTGEHDGTPT